MRLSVKYVTSLNRGVGAPLFDPALLFAGAEQGLWYEPNDLASLSQNINGTGAVTADGDLVGRMNDKSPNMNHASATGVGNRPTFEEAAALRWVQSDGADDSLQTSVDANLVFGADYEIMVSGRFDSVDTNSPSAWLNDAIISDGSDYWSIYARSSNLIGFYHYDVATKKIELPYTVGQTFILSARRTGGNLIVSLNGGAETTLAAGALSASASNLRLFRLATYSAASLYGLWATNRVWTAPERSGMLTLAGRRAGVTL